MSYIFSNSTISHISCVIPSNTIELENYSNEVGIDTKEASKIIKTTGIEKIRITSDNQTSADLCYEAAQDILNEVGKKGAEEIDALIFVSQTRDYLIPQTSNILQNKLNLKTQIICLDIQWVALVMFMVFSNLICLFNQAVGKFYY
jgi:3-oxoacyl-[acyl-carrier-protein] synthase-3